MQKILVGVLVLILAVLAYNYFLKPPSFNNGESAPNISAQLVSGETFELSDLKGHYVLLDFWGSWCPPCRKEIPDLKTLYRDYHGRDYKNATGFEIVSVALEKSDKLTKQIIQQQNMNWPYHIIDVTRVVLMSPIAQQYSVKELPTKFLINPEGEIMGTDLSFEEIRRILNERLESK